MQCVYVIYLMVQFRPDLFLPRANARKEISTDASFLLFGLIVMQDSPRPSDLPGLALSRGRVYVRRIYKGKHTQSYGKRR